MKLLLSFLYHEVTYLQDFQNQHINLDKFSYYKPDVIHDLLTLTAPLHFGSRPGTEKLLSRDESLTRLAGEAKMLWQPVCLRVLFGDDRCESHPVRQQGPGTMLDRKVSHFSHFRFRFH